MHVRQALTRTSWLNMDHRRLYNFITHINKLVLTGKPIYLQEKLTRHTQHHQHNTRKKHYFIILCHTTTTYKKSFAYCASFLWNDLSECLKNVDSIEVSKWRYKSTLMTE
ncbi:hypothetical protein PR048_000789 [Dryococelus australis]|uniref:Uncharacterized protein n=1 Tax=Dryococelus australis TaxID=614101 RepID=A0ABQ9IFQ4_9NEOP|nr:hypothetical protein PR048_000789 [Dryococelus australis]